MTFGESVMIKIFCFVFSFIFLFSSIFLFPDTKIDSKAIEKHVTIVIDPGHGGEGEKNIGATYNGLTEKELTLQVANAIKDELEQYDNITVYMTRTSDKLMTLEDRAEYAKSVGAQFLYSIHFNASAEHDFYGSEVWTSAFGNNYVKGCEFGQIVGNEWNALGLYQKGTKSKIGSSGNDYYGIIRHSVSRGIPCVILEHAYLDHEYDVHLVKSQDFLKKLGVADATAIAKYYKLKSSKTGADYSGFTTPSVKKPSGPVHQDQTEPEVCDIKVLSYDTASGNILVKMTTKDSQSPVIYFSYSYDGGNTFCTLQMWDRTQQAHSFNIKVPSGTVNPVIVCRSYNNFEKAAQSSPVTVEAAFNY